MKFTRPAGVALVVGFVYAKRSVLKVDCGNTCTMSYDKSSPSITIHQFVASHDYSGVHHWNHIQASTTPVSKLPPTISVPLQTLLRRTVATADRDLADLYIKGDVEEASPFDASFQPIDTTSVYTLQPFIADDLLESREKLQTLFCSGKDLKKKDIAGVCMDGNFLWYTSDDCSKKCKCDGNGKMSCEIPSDCGPQKDVVEYCASNPSFTCTCLSGRETSKAIDIRHHDIAQISGPAAETKETEPGLTSMIVDVPGGDTEGEKEQSEEAGIPMIAPCFLDWSCWRPRTTTSHAQRLATTLATSTIKPALRTPKKASSAVLSSLEH